MTAVHRHHRKEKNDRLTKPTGSDSTGSGPLFETKPGALNSTIELLTAADVAKLLKISLSGVRRLREQRRISFIKVGGAIRYARDDLAAYLSHSRVEVTGS